MIETSQCVVEFPPEELDFDKWQRLVNMMANLYDAASGVVVQLRHDAFNVVSTSDNSDNFLEQNSTWPWEMKSFCRRIVETNDRLYVNNAKAVDEWACVPPVAEGPVRSYLGYPLYWPDGTLFGSFCVIDTKPTDYSPALVEMLGQLKLIVEGELKLIFDKQTITSLLAEKLDAQKHSQQSLAQSKVFKEALSLQESINTATLASLADSVVRVDTSGKVLSCNLATEFMFGFENSELIGEHFTSLCCPNSLPTPKIDSDVGLFDVLTRNEVKQLNGKYKSGEVFPIQMAVSEIKVGTHSQFILLISDISEKVQYEEMLKRLALYDALTDCANRVLLEERFAYERSKAKRASSTFSLVYLDLDKFKPVNDTFGHEAGDLVLKTVVKRIKQEIRSHDLVARVGGDEFVVLFSDRVDSQTMKQKLIEAIQQPILFQETELVVSASIGLASYPKDGKELALLLNIADKNMYADKNAKES